jgi:hypothetical protein
VINPRRPRRGACPAELRTSAEVRSTLCTNARHYVAPGWQPGLLHIAGSTRSAIRLDLSSFDSKLGVVAACSLRSGITPPTGLAAGRPSQKTNCYMHGCPCGFYGDTTRECRCTGAIIQRYLGRVSGPLLDRIDLHIEVPAVPYKELRGSDQGVTSEQMRQRVAAARSATAPRVLQRAHPARAVAHALRPRRCR